MIDVLLIDLEKRPMITIHVFVFTFVLWRMRGFPLRRHRWGIVRGGWPTIYLGWFKVITGPRGIGKPRIRQKTKSSLVKLVDEETGDQITISSLDKEVTRKTAAWLRDHGVEI